MDDGSIIIPGLPNDVARQCIIRLPCDELANASKVAKKWAVEIKHPLFHLERKAMRATQSIIVVMGVYHEIYTYTPFNLNTRRWSRIPNVPELPHMLLRCGLAGVGRELVVLGGMDLGTFEFLDSIFIFNFISEKWRRGARMPGPPRFPSVCVSDSDNMVYVVGGFDEPDSITKSFMAYDVSEDKWTILPDIPKARNWGQALFHDGKLHVIEGYKYIEVFDPRKSTWDSVFCNDIDVMPGIYVNDGDGVVYKFEHNKVMLLKGIDWQVLAEIPVNIVNVFSMAICQRKLILFVRIKVDYSLQVHEMDMDNYSWKMLDNVPDCIRWVQSGCHLEI